MKRRAAIRNVIILGAGATYLYSCQDKATLTLKNIPLTGSQEKMLAALTESIIPTDDFIGAKELQSHNFVFLMTDDCDSPDDQKKFVDGMAQFEDACKRKHSSAFAKCTPEQREEFLLSIETSADIPEGVRKFYQGVKWATIQSFTSSEEFLTKVRNYSLIPGPFKGCVPIDAV